MTDISYGMKLRTALTPADAEAKVKEALSAEGFGILTEIDVAATLREKLGLGVAPYRILGACNPQLAARALQAEPDVGLLLPCNVVVYQSGDETMVAALDPATMVDLARNPVLAPIAADARERLERALSSIDQTREEEAHA